jgi:hypothetical protein
VSAGENKKEEREKDNAAAKPITFKSRTKIAVLILRLSEPHKT